MSCSSKSWKFGIVAVVVVVAVVVGARDEERVPATVEVEETVDWVSWGSCAPTGNIKYVEGLGSTPVTQKKKKKKEKRKKKKEKEEKEKEKKKRKKKKKKNRK